MEDLLTRLSNGETISNLSNIDLMRYARIFYAENIEVMNVLSLHNSFDDVFVKDIVSQKEKVKSMLKYNNYEAIDSQVSEFVCKHCPDVTKNSYDYLKIANAIAKSMFDLNQIVESRAILDFDKEEKIISKYEMVNNLNNNNFNQYCHINNSENSITNIPSIKIVKLKDAIDQYLVTMGIKEKTKIKTPVDTRSRLNWLEFIIGPDKNVCDIEYSDMINFTKILKCMPGNRTKKIEYRDKSLDELLSMNIDKKYKLADKTINTIIEAASTFFKDCVLNNYMYQNLAVNISVKNEKKDEERRDPFTLEEVNIILDGIKGKSSKMKHDWNYWLFMLALFTGGRITELCQIYAKEDIKQEDGIWYIDINADSAPKENTDGIQKELKNLSSKRKVPIHPKLIELGFLDFVFERQKTNETMLFKKITKNKVKNLGDKPSEYVNGFIDDCGIVSETKVFHSFRHTFKKMLKDNNVEEEIRHKLCGHEYKPISCTNYESDPSIKKLYNGICHINFNYEFDSINFYKLKENKKSRKSKK